MLAKAWTPEQLRDPRPLYANGLAELRGQINGGGVPEVKNRQAVRSLNYPGTFLYRNHRYRALPVGFMAGADLEAIQLRAMRLSGSDPSPESTREMIATFRKLAVIFDAHARPLSVWRRLLRPLLGNPFRAMTETEAGTLLVFFSVCRKRSSVILDAVSAESCP